MALFLRKMWKILWRCDLWEQIEDKTAHFGNT